MPQTFSDILTSSSIISKLWARQHVGQQNTTLLTPNEKGTNKNGVGTASQTQCPPPKNKHDFEPSRDTSVFVHTLTSRGVKERLVCYGVSGVCGRTSSEERAGAWARSDILAWFKRLLISTELLLLLSALRAGPWETGEPHRAKAWVYIARVFPMSSVWEL